ncbi:MAG: hypothetical protein KDA84_27105, partial [Planctomycetaceae bacterium]|nr:hypothetical protein [Planctomycetaceae bacterium]
PLKPKNSLDRVVKFAHVADSPHAILEGRVITSSGTVQFKRPFVHCWVNGYLQWTRANPIPGKPTEWKFAMNLVLNQTENTIRLEIPEVAKTPHSQTEVRLKCAKPKTEQKLHLVVVGLDPKAPAKFDTDQLKAQAANAFGLNRKNKVFKDPEIHVIPRGDVRVAAISERLMSIKASKRNPEKGEHDLIVFFYQGGELQKDDQSVLLTFDGGPTQNLLTDQKLKAMLGEISGAHLLLLDVAQINQIQEQTEADEPDHPLGILKTTYPLNRPKQQKFPLMSVLDNVLPNIREFGDLPKAVKQDPKARGQNLDVADVVPDVMSRIIVGGKEN